jgi:dipeptidyl aminopeptidase/acylaminoacyl peptidase
MDSQSEFLDIITENIPNECVFKFGNHEGYIKLPNKYSPSKKYPLILFFSGRGGSAGNSNFNSVDFTAFRLKTDERGYIVASPGYGSDCWFNEDAEKITLDMIDFISEKVSVDTSRFYIMGCSMGGTAALIFAARHPERVKAVCDVFGVTDLNRFYKESSYKESISKAYGGTPERREQYYHDRSAINLLEKYKKIPFMIIHGDEDSRVPKWNSDILVRKMHDYKISVKYSVISGIGHENRIINGLENSILDFFDNFK